MKLPRPRFTVRRLMVAVAIVGLMLGLVILLHRRSSDYFLAARSEDAAIMVLADTLAVRPNDEASRRKMKWHLRRFEIFERGYKRPWLPLRPIPPEPE